MNGLPYYKAYPRDFIEGTVGMPFEMKAAYRLVLDLIYMQGGRLPDDAGYISGLLGCSVRKWNALRASLIKAEKLYAKDGIIGNFRADNQLETSRKLQDKNAENGRQSNKNNYLNKPNDQLTRGIESEPDTESNIPVGFANAQPTAVAVENSPDPEPANSIPEWHGSAEEEFWRMAPALQAKEVARSQIGQLANLLAGDFEAGTGILRDTLMAKSPRPYLAKIINGLRSENAPPPQPDPKLPSWVTEARTYGYPVEREGKYWRFAGGLFDDAKLQVGN